MYTAFYHWRLVPGREEEFAALWKEGTLLFRTEQNSLGSRLHLADDGTYFAYAQWPSREAFHREKMLSPRHQEILTAMYKCMEKGFPSVLGEVKIDLLVHPEN